MSLTSKLIIGKVLNTIGAPMIVFYINYGQNEELWKTGGIVYTAFYLVSMASIFTPLYKLVQPYQIYKKIKQWCAARKGNKNYDLT